MASHGKRSCTTTPVSLTNVAASTSAENLPSYEQLRAEHNLKETFSKIIKDSDDIQGLFISVAAQLESTPKIGEDHELTEEWNKLRQRYRKLHRGSQLNAGQCASFLGNYSSILVPLARSSMTIREKTLMIDRFIEAIPVHQEAARRTTEGFHELGKEVEVFPIKVSAFLRNAADTTGILGQIWSGLEDLCLSIWNALEYLFKSIVNAFKSLLDRIGNIRLSCFTGVYLQVDIELSQPSQMLRQRAPSRSAFGQAKQDCRQIAGDLYGFEDAWHLVQLSCDRLLHNVSMAKKMTHGIPKAYDAHMNNTGGDCTVLIQCLTAYSTGRLPI